MMKTTVVIPCYNEAQRLSVAAFVEHARDCPDQHFLLVDDGSQDNTWEVLQSLQEKNPAQFACLQLEQNSGKAEAVRRGVLAALDGGTDLVGYWDADLATPLAAIGRFRDVLVADDNLNIVMGSRVQLLGRRIERRPARHYIGRVFATLASIVLKLPVYDTQCGAKLFRAGPIVREIFEQPFRTSWVFDIELLARYSNLIGSTQARQTIYEFPLERWRDVPGSKLRLHHGFRAGWDLLLIRRNYPPTVAGSRNSRCHSEGKTAAPAPSVVGSDNTSHEA